MKSTTRSIAIAIGLSCIVAATAFAGSDTPVRRTKQAQQTQQQTKVRKECYIVTGASAIPLPCDQVRTPIATTAIPYEVIGNYR